MAKNSFTKIVLASVAGLAAGLAIGFLFAPEKGSVTRQKMKDKFQDLSDAVKEGLSKEKDQQV